MCKKLHCSARFVGIKMRLLKADDCAELAKKAEIANILFNIMNEAEGKKRGYKRRKEIAAFREGYEQHGRQCGVKKGTERKMEKGVDKSLRGRYNSKAVGRERQASETEVRAEGCERK